MVRRAAAFLARNGPVSPQDRWEEEPGYSPFTIATEIAALLVAADLADAASNKPAADYLRETADAWNSSVERWLYCSGTELAHQHGVDGYYVRVAVPDRADAASPCHGFVPIKNRPPDQAVGPAALMVSLDALAFVRFGLRAPDDPRIVNTVRVVDATLKVDTPRGPVWHRYQGDGYGEHPDGGPFDGTGVGRGWPLLTGERAHYELAAGRRDTATELAHAMEALAGESGLLPEQVWDSADIPDRDCSSGTRPARRCRSCGRMPSMSSCVDRFRTGRSSIGRRRLFSGTWLRRRRLATSPGASIIRFAQCPRAERSA
jgi:glucoamylase